MSLKTQHFNMYLKPLKMSSSVYGNFHKDWLVISTHFRIIHKLGNFTHKIFVVRKSFAKICFIENLQMIPKFKNRGFFFSILFSNFSNLYRKVYAIRGSLNYRPLDGLQNVQNFLYRIGRSTKKL